MSKEPLEATQARSAADGTRVVLAGDIGGTKTLLQLVAFAPGERRGRMLREQRFSSGSYSDLAPMARDFLAAAPDAGPCAGACFGVAGPVEASPTGGTARLTNLPWRLDAERLAAELGLPRVRLINDFQAIGFGIEALEGDELATLQAGEPRPRAPRAVLGAGTGLGVGILCWDNDHYEAYPTEGGHAHFAPVDAEQDALLQELRERFGRVSYERLLSGPGLEAIYRFLLGREGGDAAGDPLLTQDDPAAAVSMAAMRGTDPLADRALDLFVSIYGAKAGDLALTCLAYGGIYVAGGIAPKIIERLRAGRFIEAFNDKGRMRRLCEAMPVHVVMNPKVGLEGAALAASRL